MLRHRWYAGSIAALLSGALLFAGMTPAVAETLPSPSATDPSVSNDPGDTTEGDTSTDPSTEPSAEPSESTEPSETPSEPSDTEPTDETDTESADTETTDKSAARQAARAETQVQTLAAGPPINCVPNTFYSQQDNGTVKQIANGTVTNFGTGWPGRSDVNGIAIGANGAVMYAYDRSGGQSQNISGILRYTPASNTWEELPNTSYQTGNTNSLVTGAVNLANGRYLFGGYSGQNGDLVFKLYEYNPSSNGITYVGFFDTGFDSDATANGDMAFDSAGNLYIIRSGQSVNVYTVTAATLAAASSNPGNVMTRSATNNMSLGISQVNGIAFNADGTVFLGNDSDAVKFNPTTWANLGTATNSLGDSTDLASCNSPANLTVKKNVVGRAAAGDQFTIAVSSGQTQVATATTEGNANGVQTQQIGPIPVIAGSAYSISEVAAGGGSLASYTTTWSCDNGQSGTGASGSVNIPNTGGASVVCTFTNTPLQGSLQINKVVAGGGVASTTTFAIDYNCGTGFTGTVNVTTAAGATINGIPTGRSCTVSENTGQLTTSKLIDASYSWNIGQSGKVDPAGAQVIVTGQTKVFTVTNTTTRNYGTINITKALSGIAVGDLVTGAQFTGTWSCVYGGSAVAAGTWSVTGSGAATLVANQGSLSQIPLTSVCSVQETAPANSLFKDQSYSWASSVVTPATATVGSGTPASFTVTNTAQRASLTLVKQVDNTNGGTAVVTDWNQKLQAKRGSDAAILFNTGEQKYVPSGTYNLSEINQIAGYELTGITCGGSATPVNSVQVPANGNVTCTFKNASVKPNLILEKQVVNTGGGTATADEWTLTATNNGTNVINEKGTIVSPNVAATKPAAVKGGVAYTLTETGPSGYTQATAWSCVLTGSQTPVNVTNNNVVTPKIGENVTCRIVNTAVPGTGTVAKTVTSTVQNPNGTWTVTYQIVVTNTSATSIYTYDLKDVLNFGGDITPAKPQVTGPAGVTINPAFTGLAPNTTIASGVALTKGGTHSYTVVVNATVADVVADPGNTAAQCKPPAAGGFLNTASIFKPGATDPDGSSAACSQPVFPNIAKAAGAVRQNPDASFNVQYTITLSNPSATTAVQATLTDAFPAAPSGWTLSPNSWTVTAGAGSPAPQASPYAPGNGTIWAGSLAANTTYTYTVKATLVAGANATPIGQCEAGGGLKNKATVTSGLVVKDAEACVTVTAPPVTISKTNAGAVSQLSLTQWEIVYTVEVRNSSQTIATTYTLTDAPTPGNGWIVDASSNWVGTAPVANTVIEGGGVDSFQYRMVVNRNADVSNPSTSCDLTTGGGFFNKATVTFPGGTASDTGCGEPGTPTVVKTGKPATANGDGTYTISYDVDVKNTSGKPLFYSLTDTPPANPAGTTITDWKVTGPNASATWPTPNVIAAQSIANGATHTFTITAKVAIGAGFTPVPAACGEGTSTGVAIVNTATVTNSIKAVSDDGCTSVNSLPVTIEKKVDSVEQAIDGTWTVKYTVSVKGPASGTTPYSLTDTPAFASAQGVTFTGISWTGQTSGTSTTGPVTLQSAGTISAGQTHTWNLTATATIAVPQGTTLADCVPGQSGPFFNSAKVTFPGGNASATACDEPGKPTVEKTALAPAFDANTGQWTLSYDLTVTNKQGTNLAYTLSDTPAALPSGVTPTGPWTATGPTITGSTPQDAGTLAGWNGVSGTVATGLISTDATHVYKITRVVTIGANVSGDALDCGVRGGIKNVGTVTNGVGGNSDDACITITRPGVDIVKTVSSTTQNVDGSWTVVYDVAVTNESPTQVAQYGLTDQIAYGTGIVPTAATWKKEPSGAVTPFQAPITGIQTLATDAVLAGGATDHYTVTVTSTISADAWKSTSSTLTCAPEGTFTAGGFLNTATATAAGKAPEKDDACSAPELPKVLKEGVSATQDAVDPEKWAVTYLVTVTAGKYATYYDLSDTPAFASGITLGAGTAQRTDIPGQPVESITSGADFVIDRAIAANTSHTYAVTWNVTVTDEFEPADGACTDLPGKGFFNTATLTVGAVPIDDAACIPVEPRVYPTIEKTVTSTEQKTDGDWVITYDVVVKLAPKGEENPKGLSAKYDLTDTLDFGGDINIGNAEWTYDGTTTDFEGDTATMATDRSIAAGGTHTYTVRVLAAVTEEAIEGDTTKCQEGDSGPYGGFLNTAQLESGGQLTDVDACSEPVFPDVDKTAVGDAVLDPETGLWRVTYQVTVAYPEVDTEGDNPVVAYTLTDAPTLPANVQLQGDWTASAKGAGTPTPTVPTWNGQGTWTIVTSTLDPDETDVTQHVYEVTAQVRVTAPATGEPATCDEEPGIVVLNGATITSGGFTDEDEACQVVHWDDVGIVKTSELPDDQTWVEPGDTFNYVLTVTNYGTRPATNVEVTDDDLNDRLEITGLTVTPGSLTWGPAPGYEGNVVDLTIDSLPVGGVATITVEVEFLPAAVTDDDVVGPGEEPPTAPTPVDQLDNTACVTATNDGNPENNCDDEEIPVRDLTGVLYIACVSDAAKLGWSVAKSGSLTDLPIDMFWEPNNGVGETVPPNVQMTQAGGSTTWSDVIDWPGSEYTPSGVAVDYPGWRAIVQSDVVPGSTPTQYYLPGTDTVMTPEQQAQFVYNGLILDPSELDFAWREGSTVTFTVNPELVFETSYPAATPEGCSVARHSDVQIEKTASVEKTEPGKSFTYTLEVENVSDDSAADGVVVTDVIPSDIRISDITWPGKGDATAFPNWTTCDITGKGAGGFGGTLECVLFGPLQPAGTPAGGTNVAPTITLTAHVSPTAKASVINNIGVVDYHTFGDPEDSGRDQDDATVLLSALPATGGESLLPIAIIALVALLGGVGALIVVRRRKGESRPVL